MTTPQILGLPPREWVPRLLGSDSQQGFTHESQRTAANKEVLNHLLPQGSVQRQQAKNTHLSVFP